MSIVSSTRYGSLTYEISYSILFNKMFLLSNSCWPYPANSSGAERKMRCKVSGQIIDRQMTDSGYNLHYGHLLSTGAADRTCTLKKTGSLLFIVVVPFGL